MSRLTDAERERSLVISYINSCDCELDELREKQRAYRRRLDAVSNITVQMNMTFDSSYTSRVSSLQADTYNALDAGIVGLSHKGSIASSMRGNYEKSMFSDSKMSESHSLIVSEVRRLQDLVDSCATSIRDCSNKRSGYQSQLWSLNQEIASLRAQEFLRLG